MTGFDFLVIAIVALSALLGFITGFVRVVVSLGTWIVALVLAVQISPAVEALLPAMRGTPALRYLTAFAIIVIVVLIVGALLGWMLYRLVRAVGLAFLDRLLGFIVGVARGVLIAVIGVLAAGLTSLPHQLWWQNAVLAPPLVVAASSVKPWLPRSWAEQLDYGKSPRPVPKPAARAGV